MGPLLLGAMFSNVADLADSFCACVAGIGNQRTQSTRKTQRTQTKLAVTGLFAASVSPGIDQNPVGLWRLLVARGCRMGRRMGQREPRVV